MGQGPARADERTGQVTSTAAAGLDTRSRSAGQPNRNAPRAGDRIKEENYEPYRGRSRAGSQQRSGRQSPLRESPCNRPGQFRASNEVRVIQFIPKPRANFHEQT